MNSVALSARQVGFELRTFRRNRAGMMFTFLFPILFLGIFGMTSSGKTESFRGGSIPFIQFFVAGILAYGVIGASYTNLAMRVVTLRESGVLKRVRGTPLPRLSYLIGQIGASVVIAVVISIITLALAVALYGVNLYAETASAAIVTLIIGSACFCAIGLAVAALVPNADSAPGIVNFTILPIIFISDVFYSVADAPHWLQQIAGFFPVKHFANALQVAFDPHTKGLGFSGRDLAVMTIWGVAATVWTSRHFRWESKTTS